MLTGCPEKRQWHTFISEISDNSEGQHKDSAVQVDQCTTPARKNIY